MISIVIRSRNESRDLDYCLKKLDEQDIGHEVIVVDSHSEDDTQKVAEIHRCKVVQCEDFTFGKALNQDISASTGDYIGIMSGHCFPTSKDYLKILQKNLLIKKIAGVYARQIPHKDTNPLEYRNFIYTYKLEPSIQKKCPFFNNAASMIRRDVWDEIKFDEVVKAQEDIIWAAEAQKQGYAIAYEPDAIVEHLHTEDTSETVQRYIREYNVLKEVWHL